MRVAITGGIGAGKTAVSECIRNMGGFVIDADECSREILEPQAEGYKRILSRYGNEIINDDGTINREKLASIIFSSESERKEVEALLHPPVIQRLLDIECEYRRKCSVGPVFFEIPLLFETGLDKLMDEVWLVFADEDLRVERIIKRSACTAEQARARMSAQMPLDKMREYKHTELDNSGTKEELCAKVERLYKKLLKGIEL